MALIKNTGAKTVNGFQGPLPYGGTADRTLELTPQVKELFEQQGMSRVQIAKKLNMSQDTVRKILKEGAEEGAKNALKTINIWLPRIAEMVCKRIIEKEDVPHGIEIMEKSGVFPLNAQPTQGFSDPRLMIAIQNLLPAQSQHPSMKAKEPETIDAANSSPETN